MYGFKQDLNIKFNKAKASKEIGITRPYLTSIINGKKLCTKVMAFCITKYLNDNAEIEDYFIRKEK